MRSLSYFILSYSFKSLVINTIIFLKVAVIEENIFIKIKALLENKHSICEGVKYMQWNIWWLISTVVNLGEHIIQCTCIWPIQGMIISIFQESLGRVIPSESGTRQCPSPPSLSLSPLFSTNPPTKSHAFRWGSGLWHYEPLRLPPIPCHCPSPCPFCPF